MATVSYQSHVLNLYSDESTDVKHFQLQPLGDKLSVSYKYNDGTNDVHVPVHMDLLELQDGTNSVDVVTKMNLNAQAVVDENVRARGIEAGLQSGLDSLTN